MPKYNNLDVIYIRIDSGIKQKLDSLAVADNRSLNNYVVKVLTDHVDSHKPKKDKSKKNKK